MSLPPERPGAPVVFAFHGALDQSRRTIPAFAGRFLTRKSSRFGTVISVADPALGIDPALKLTWFAATEGSDTPAGIAALIAGISARLNPSRVIFTGGSAGAHAALRHARDLPGSVAVVVNPRMRIRPSRYWKDYARLCWPAGTRSPAELRAAVPDIADLAAEPGEGGTIVYLLNALDEHLAPARRRVPRRARPARRRAAAGRALARLRRAQLSAAGLGRMGARRGARRRACRWPSWPSRRRPRAGPAAARPEAPSRQAARSGGFDDADLRLADQLAATAE